ncbi:OmpA family protein [Sunxiuqinia indica]|uniref:OmpA family protein n=1 Tax=Sunxiuqinia indica TaxID=2692584 RepID=UPI00135BE1D0|nr:OmpA family protein [Sunxiuqinia indica]
MKKRYIQIFIFILIAFSGNAQKSLFDDVDMSIDTLQNINTPYSDFGPAIIEDELIFSSYTEEAGKKSDKKNKAFYDLFSSDLNLMGNIITDRRKLTTMISQYHEGPLTFCENTGELFLTQSNWENPQELNIVFKKKNIRLGIVIYEKTALTWQFKEKFPYNSSEYSVAHPTISESGDTLIFVSDMPGGMGMTDLYYCVRQDTGWSKPINLGPKVNTAGKEMFPFLNSDGSLVFSSDGHAGEGNLDLFYIDFPITEYSQRSTFTNNINSPADDFGLVVHPNQRSGYFSSNREGGVGDDDIYYLKMEDYRFNIMTLSNYTKRALIGANVNIIDGDGQVAATGQSDSDGKMSVKLDVDKKYTLIASIDNYLDQVVDLDLTDEGNFVDKNYKVYLDPEFVFQGQVVDILGNIPIPDAMLTINDGNDIDTIYADYQGQFKHNIEPEKDYKVNVTAYNFFGTDIDFNTVGMKPGLIDYLVQLYSLDAGTRIELENIYYDLAKWNIRPDAAQELDKLVSVLEEYPDLQIRLESHTDSRGGDEFNMELSRKRSKSAFDYLVSKGIDPSRVEHVGFGESQLVNKCDDGVSCTEAEHAENRRTVVEILKAKVTRRSKGNIFYF